MWLIIATVLLMAAISLAAYTNFSSVKRVVSTEKPGDTLFSSNYLYLLSFDQDSSYYQTRRISPAEIKDGSGDVTGYRFEIQVCNYVYGYTSAWNTDDIEYTFTVTVKPRGSEILPDNAESIEVIDASQQLSAGVLKYTLTGQSLGKSSANYKTYTITVPAELKDKILLEIVAEPAEGSKVAVNNKKLAANITLSTLEATKDWTGKFLDSKDVKPSEYDGYNYEIAGNGEGTVTLSWNSDVLQISKWFLTDARTLINKDGKSCTFSVGDSKTAYHLQFYRVPGATIPDSWDTMNGYVSVSFNRKAD